MTVIIENSANQLQQLTLPKWPQMLVWGRPVTPAQAKDVIFRTDPFLCSPSPYAGGNNRPWNDWAREILGLTSVLKKSEPHDYAFQGDVMGKYAEAMGQVETKYVTNNWASSPFMGGPHGWCHPDGTIGYADNVGKWPSALELFEEWTILAKAFPFLDLTVTFMSGEACEEGCTPVFSLRVTGGAVVVTETAMPAPSTTRAPSAVESFIENFKNPRREQGLPDAWIEELGVKSRDALARIIPEVMLMQEREEPVLAEPVKRNDAC